jgi:hypothetical protein
MNPKLKVGDRVCLLYMPGEISMSAGECGTVKSVDNVFGDIQYGVKWDNGSNLALLSDTDAWTYDKKQIKENELDRMNVLYKNIDAFRFFKMGFLHKYLLAVRKSGIVNMFGAGDYLWMGRERIKHEFKYKDIPNEEAFEEMLDMSDQAQAEMINGVIDYLESKGIEEDMSTINKYLKIFASKIVQNYMHIG